MFAGIEARTAIGHRHRHAVGARSRIDDDVAIGRRIARRILQQVRQRDGGQPRVDVDDVIGVGLDAQRVPVDRVPRVGQCRVDDIGGRRPSPRVTWTAAASMRAMSRMLSNSRVRRRSSAAAASACARRLSIGRSFAKVVDGHPEDGQRRLQIVAERRQQRRGQLAALPLDLGGFAFFEKLRALDGDAGALLRGRRQVAADDRRRPGTRTATPSCAPRRC